MIARRSALALVGLVGCGSHPHAATDAQGGEPPPGDCHCDGSAGSMIDAAIDAPVCDTTPACPAGMWCTETSPAAATVELHGVWAIDNNDVYAVGDSGTILRRRCNTWTAMTSGTTNRLNAVWSSGTTVWVVGDAGTILKFAGAAWTPVTGVTTQDLYAISGTSDTDVWLVGGSGQALRWDGANWTTRGVGGNMLGVSGTGDGDVWVATEAAYVAHCNSSALWTNTTPWPTLMPEGNSVTDYFAVLERSSTNVWVASVSGNALQYNGSVWTSHSTSGAVFHSLWARADADIWGAGDTQVGHWNGSSWSVSTPMGVTQPLYGVTGTSTDVWVVGTAAKILHQD